MRPPLAAGVVLAAGAAAFAADGPDDPEPRVSGDVRAGWRLLSGDEEGRFPQDAGLKDGPRVFDVNLYGEDPRRTALLDEAEVHLTGIGDPNSDYLARLARGDEFELTGGYRRDDFSYRATSDLFPYDTVRERSSVHGTWRALDALTVRFGWDRSERRGDAFTQGLSFVTNRSVSQHRTISQETDRYSLAADFAEDVFRFGVGETIAVSHGDDSRTSDAPGSDPTSDVTRVLVRQKSYTTTARAGVVLPRDLFSAMLFLTRTEAPLAEEASGSIVDDTGDRSPLRGEGELRRTATDWRLETSWRPHDDWLVSASAARGDAVDEEEGEFRQGGFALSTPSARITDRTRRYSGEVAWDVADDVRLRVGEEFLEEELVVPTDSHFAIANEFKIGDPTDHRAASWRTTAGADWKPSPKVSVSGLARVTTTDEPLTTAVPDRGDEYSLRVRWDSAGGERVPPESRCTLTSVVKRKSLSRSGDVLLYEMGHFPDASLGERPFQTADLGSATRATSVAETATYTRDRWTFRGTASYRRFDTTADTAWGSGDNGFLTFDTSSFRSREVALSADVGYEVIPKRLRVLAAATRTHVHGDSTARWLDLSAGGEYDLLRKGDDPLLTLGLTLSSWRLEDKESTHDDYSVHAVEVSLTYHF